MCLCNNVNGYDKNGVGGYLYRDLYLKSYEIVLKITLSFKTMKGGAMCLILEL